MVYIQMPEEFFSWQIEERKRSLDVIKKGGMPGFFAHSPVMATCGKKGMNLACKGVGLVIKQEFLEEFTQQNEELVKRALKGGWKKTLEERLDRLVNFYANPELIDKSCLGTIEMYGTKTYSNIQKKNPKALLMYNDFNMQKGIISYQLDCVVELQDAKNLFYNYIKSMHDLFHMPSNKDYFCAYKFRIKAVYDKSPRGGGKRIV